MKVKKIELKINYCIECPFYEDIMFSYYGNCKKIGRIDHHGIPDNCPFEDVDFYTEFLKDHNN